MCGVRMSLLCRTGPHGRHMALPAQRSAASGQFPLSMVRTGVCTTGVAATGPRCGLAAFLLQPASRECRVPGVCLQRGVSAGLLHTSESMCGFCLLCFKGPSWVDLSGLSPALSVLFPAPSGELQAYTACLFMYCEFVCVLYIKRQCFFCLPTTSFSPFGGEIATVENVSVYRYLMDLLLLEKVSFKIVYFLTAAITN